MYASITRSSKQGVCTSGQELYIETLFVNVCSSHCVIEREETLMAAISVIFDLFLFAYNVVLIFNYSLCANRVFVPSTGCVYKETSPLKGTLLAAFIGRLLHFLQEPEVSQCLDKSTSTISS